MFISSIIFLCRVTSWFSVSLLLENLLSSVVITQEPSRANLAHAHLSLPPPPFPLSPERLVASSQPSLHLVSLSIASTAGPRRAALGESVGLSSSAVLWFWQTSGRMSVESSAVSKRDERKTKLCICTGRGRHESRDTVDFTCLAPGRFDKFPWIIEIGRWFFFS